MSFATKSPAFSSISNKQRSLILRKLNYDHVYLKMREGSGVQLNDSGNLAESNPGVSAITNGYLTLAGTQTFVWSAPNKGVDFQADDNYAGINRDDDAAFCNFFTLGADYRGYLLISAFVDLDGSRPAAPGDYIWGIGGHGSGRYGSFALRYADNGLAFGMVAGTTNGDTWVSGNSVSGIQDDGTPGKKHVVQIIDMSNGWGEQTTHCVFVDGVLGTGGWQTLPADKAALGPPVPQACGIGIMQVLQNPSTTFTSGINNDGVKHMKDFFAIKLPATDFTKVSIAALVAEWSNYESEFPFGLIP